MATQDEEMRDTDVETEWTGSSSEVDENEIFDQPPKYTTMLFETQAIFDYPNFEKGAIADEANIARPCSPEFIDAIMKDLDCLIEVSSQESLEFSQIHDLFESCLLSTLSASERLILNPDLIADPNVREIFCQYVHTFCDALAIDPSLPTIPDIVDKVNTSSRKQNLKSFDKKRVPWHQFLHHYAPGSNASVFQRQDVSEVGVRQIIPPGGLKLLRGWEQDIRDTQCQIYPDRPPETGRGITKSIAQKERAIGGRNRYRLIATIPGGPSPFEERILPHTQSLETLSRDLARWDVTHEEGPNRAITPYMFVAECTADEWRRWREQSLAGGGN